MGEELLLGFGAVVLGWLLNELSGSFRTAREERRLIRQSIPPLLTLYFEQYRIDQILSVFNRKMGDDFERLVQETEKDPTKRETIGSTMAAYLEDFEDLRRRNVSLPHVSRESMIQTTADVALKLAAVDPIGAYRAQQLCREFLLFQDIQMPSKGTNPQSYMSVLVASLSVYRQDLQTDR